MSGTLLMHVQSVVLADPSTSGLQSWLRGNVVTVLVLLIGIVLLFAAQKGNAARVVMITGLSLVGLMWLGLAASGSIDSTSRWLAGLVGLT